jgi:hypothetical protein
MYTQRLQKEIEAALAEYFGTKKASRVLTDLAEALSISLSTFNWAEGIENLTSDETEVPWREYTQWHWAVCLDGERLDYWPTKSKWQYKNLIYYGDVYSFIRKNNPTGLLFSPA